MRKITSPKWKFASGLAGALLCAATFAVTPANAAGDEQAMEHVDWSFSGPFGMFDRGQIQRGYQVYKEVCSACHGLRQLHYRNLGEAGGPEFSIEAVKALAAEVEVRDGPNNEGEMFDRPGKPSDAFVSPFPNDQAARAANNGALPPDLSLIAKARSIHRDVPWYLTPVYWAFDIFSAYDEEKGANYLFALMTGYKDAPDDMKMAEGMNYNAVFPGHQIAMASPLDAEVVDYTDGTAPTLENYSKDVAAFLTWAAEPKLEERHKLGFRFMIYLILLAGLLYLAKRKVWSKLEH
jgi:cytochrome c1